MDQSFRYIFGDLSVGGAKLERINSKKNTHKSEEEMGSSFSVRKWKFRLLILQPTNEQISEDWSLE
jgi:hypothetical protein